MFTIFGSLALFLGALGMYATMSAFVAQRTREFSIRIALGASGKALIRLVGAHALFIVVAGIAVGIICAFAGVRSMEHLLFGVHARSLTTFALSAVVVMLASVAACALPLARALRTAPAAALRA